MYELYVSVVYPSFIRRPLRRVAADRDYARMLQGHIWRISTRLLDLAKRLRPGPTRALDANVSRHSRRMPGRPPPLAISPLQPPAGYLPIPIGFVIALKCSDSWRAAELDTDGWIDTILNNAQNAQILITTSE